MIKDALEGVANGKYDMISVRPSSIDDQCISYYIERKKVKTYAFNSMPLVDEDNEYGLRTRILQLNLH